jgi:DNA-binding transcriptional LysR family regulator
MIPLLTKKIRSIHPGIDFTVLSHSSEEILRGLADFSIDVGITYLDNEPIDGMLASPLYVERYCLFVPESHSLANRASVTWQEASQEPLCLLTTNMQNRRIIDRAFETAKCHPSPRLETNSVINLCSNVRLMGLASIMPQYVLEVLGNVSGIKAIPLDHPKVEHSVGLVVADRDPLSPLIEALREATTKLAPVSFGARA